MPPASDLPGSIPIVPPDFESAASRLLARRHAEEILLAPGRAVYLPDWLPPEFADRLQAECLRELHWSSPSLKMFGRRIPIPRRHAFIGDTGVHYRWSGLEQRAEPWTPMLAEVRHFFADLGLGFNSLLANHYRSGADSMGWHADDEKELGASPVIATVSLGQERKLRFKPKGEGAALGVLLHHGSLLLTSGEVQNFWLHQVAKSRRRMNSRISLTFRYIAPQK